MTKVKEFNQSNKMLHGIYISRGFKDITLVERKLLI